MLDELASARAWNWDKEKGIYDTDFFLDQSVLIGGFNYRHGSVYLAASESKAVEYALSNRYGSELLTRTFEVFERLKEYDVHRAHEIIEKFPELLKLYEMPDQPLLVEAFDIPIRNLRTELGEDPSHMLSVMKGLWRKWDMESNSNKELREPFIFELVSPHPAHNLKFYCIERTNTDPYFRKYSLKIV